MDRDNNNSKNFLYVLDDFEKNLQQPSSSGNKIKNHNPKSTRFKQSSSLGSEHTVEDNVKRKEMEGKDTKLTKRHYTDRVTVNKRGSQEGIDVPQNRLSYQNRGNRFDKYDNTTNMSQLSLFEPEEGDSQKPQTEHGNPSNRPMGYKRLEDLLSKDSASIITTLANSRSGLKELLETRPIRPDLLMLTMKVLNQINKSEMHQLKIKILSETLTPEMFDEIKRYAQQICIESDHKRLMKIGEFFEDILGVFVDAVNSFPSIMTENFKSVLMALNLSMKNAMTDQGISIKETLFDALKSVTDQVSSYIENSKRINHNSSASTSFKDIKSPNNFREMAIVPTIEDFTCPRAFLRPNVVKGGYRDCDDYLEVQFRLLREDFIAPLRTGLLEYVESLNSPHLRRRFSNVKVYGKIQFLKSFNTRDRVGFQINFDVDNKLPPKINWEYNKRFKIGSLLLLTLNNFKDFFLATITDRDTKLLEKKILSITFVPGTMTPEQIFGSDLYFTMAESEVYYEAYRPVLIALQKMTEKTFPMKQYIVDVKTSSFPPNYLVEKQTYIVDDYEIDVLNEISWPSPAQMKLNLSQHRAFQTALTNEFAVIQGPPGTGKTFLALKITEVLLKNDVSKDTPIIVICYTNHALDQFLEGILRFTDNLIRIGSQSQNEVLQEYNLDKMRRSKREARVFNTSPVYKDTMRTKCELKEKIEGLERKVNELYFPRGILNVQVLKSVTPPHHYNELAQNVVSWLLFEDSPEWVEQEINSTARSEGSSESFMIPTITQSDEVIDDPESEGEYDEENSRRLADIYDESYLDDEFERERTDMLRVSYAFNLTMAELELRDLEIKLNYSKMSNSKNRDASMFYYQLELQEKIKILSLKIGFVNHQIKKLSYFQVNAEKIGSFYAKQNIWEILPCMRWEYYWTLVHSCCCQLNQTIHYLTDRYQDVLTQLDELRQLDDMALVRSARVVGLTTSGAAKRRVLLENLGTKIVIVEEAAEVLEAHIVTGLSKSVQHVILIGDHKQLKPNPAVYQLAKKYNMDVSLFERMLNNGLNCSVLGVQHRMRPEIASLICPTIYPDLINHPSTFDRSRISGIDKYVFFLTHNHQEDQLPDSTSKQNTFEGDFLIELCQYLMSNGYKAEEITILATYIGQVWYMRKAKRRLSAENPDWKSVRITPVDNFQGEENRIILLSLVRSNKEARIGFLDTENRVCVALSRARDGLYIVGNMDNLTASSIIWPKIQLQLQEMNAIGKNLVLRCEIHPEQVTLVSSAQHFSGVPQGGCSLPCQFQLSCGHVCPRICHIQDKDHEFFECRESCNRPPCEVAGHKCPLKCFKPCLPCNIQVEKSLPCGHSALIPCHQEPASVKCLVRVPAVHQDCGHDIEKPCFMDLADCKCPQPCPQRLPCGHACVRNCHVADDSDHVKYKCMKSCEKPNLECRRNHKCPKQCYQECGECTVEVRAELPCGHMQDIECHVDVESVVCIKPCKKLLPCTHKCKLQCFMPCDPAFCNVKVDKTAACGHLFKNIACNEVPDVKKCHAPCTRTLACGHPCTDTCDKDCSKTLCQEMVESRVAPKCYHPRIMIPCHLNKPELNPGCDELLQLCEAECKAKLMCGHECEGLCGRCMNGRLHQQCYKPCNKRLICGHMCTDKCGKLCPPCSSKVCFSHCAHNRCAENNKKKRYHCNHDPCTPCNKPCAWVCEHEKCTKRCGEECNRNVCNQPCQLKLDCGHPCLGYCGEVCPPLCSVCQPDDPHFFLTPTTRFVVLEDCGHIVESRTLMQMVDEVSDPSRIGGLIFCPECSHPVVKTMRSREIYLRFLQKCKQMHKQISTETQWLEKKYKNKVSLFRSHPTSSGSLNALLIECLNGHGNPHNKILILKLLTPLINCCLNFQRKTSSLLMRLEGKSKVVQRLMLRLEYLALCIKPRLMDIGIEDIRQIQLEVRRIVHILNHATSRLIPGPEWYDLDTFSGTAVDRVTLFQTSLAETLKTRILDRDWYECQQQGQHWYKSDKCHICEESDLKLEIAEREPVTVHEIGRATVHRGNIPTEGYRPPMHINFHRGRGRGRGRRGRGRRQ